MPLAIIIFVLAIVLVAALMMGVTSIFPPAASLPVQLAEADNIRAWTNAEIDMAVNRHMLILENTRRAAEVEAQKSVIWAQASANIAVILIGGIVAIIVIAALIVMMRQAAQARRIIEDLRQQQIEAVDGGYRLDGLEWIVKSTNKELEYRR